MFYRWYITPKKKSQMNKSMSHNFWKCDKEGSFFHLWWTCLQVKKFWAEIHQEMMKILKIGNLKLPEIYLLGVKLEEFKITDRLILWFAAAAERLLLT